MMHQILEQLQIWLKDEMMNFLHEHFLMQFDGIKRLLKEDEVWKI
jgi:hypothetical protein